MVYGIIYKIENKINKKIYIGQTTNDLKIRIRCHKYDHKRKDYYLYRSMRKYGWENFEFSIIKECLNQEDLNNSEIFFIQKFNSIDPKNGYNLDYGGGGVGGRSEFVKQKITEGLLKLNEERPEILQNLRIGFQKYFSDPNNRKKQSEICKKIYDDNPEMRQRAADNFKKYYQENPNILSERQIERWKNPEFRKKTSDSLSKSKRSHHPECKDFEKYCPCCKLVKNKKCFGNNKVRRDGLENRCRDCRSIAGKKHYENKAIKALKKQES